MGWRLTEVVSGSNSSNDMSLKTSPMMDLTAASLASASGGGEIWGQRTKVKGHRDNSHYSKELYACVQVCACLTFILICSALLLVSGDALSGSAGVLGVVTFSRCWVCLLCNLGVTSYSTERQLTTAHTHYGCIPLSLTSSSTLFISSSPLDTSSC